MSFVCFLIQCWGGKYLAGPLPPLKKNLEERNLRPFQVGMKSISYLESRKEQTATSWPGGFKMVPKQPQSNLGTRMEGTLVLRIKSVL